MLRCVSIEWCRTLSYELLTAGLQAYVALADGAGVTRLKVPAVEMHEAPFYTNGQSVQD